MKRQLMAEQWSDYARLVLPSNAPVVQKLETRRAFYAGAQAILFKVIDGFAPESEPTAEDLEMMAGVHHELQDFAALVKEGRA